MVDLTLSAPCPACNTTVAVDVPRWITNAMETAQAGNDGERRRERSAQEEQPQSRRSGVVGAAVCGAKMLRDSPLPGMLLYIFRTLTAFVLYLDARFSLHERLTLVVAAFFEGLVEIEKEVGILQRAGEGLSVGWEATVRGIIAFAKNDTPPRQSRRATPANFHPPSSRRPANSCHTASPYDSPSGHPHEASASRSYPSPQHAHHLYGSSSESAYPFPSSAQHLEVPGFDGSNQGFDARSRPSSPPTASYDPPRPLRRAPFSSPTLQSAYLSPTSPHHASLLAETPDVSLSSSPSEASLPPYFAQDGVAHPPPFSTYNTSFQRPRMTRQRSRSGPDVSPSRPEAVRGSSWAGKAVLGLAERMKVL
ncbi:hypothetical protein JCM8547_001121 [Rhodosporidiobolus lusitaniae]